jgi:hypothetical protein
MLVPSLLLHHKLASHVRIPKAHPKRHCPPPQMQMHFIQMLFFDGQRRAGLSVVYLLPLHDPSLPV